MQTYRTWDEVAPRYHRKWVGVGPFGCTGTMLDMVGVHNTDIILDVACGTGAVLTHLAKRVQGGRIIGVDSSAGALAIARRQTRHLANVQCVRADAESMWFACQFDTVTCQFGLFFFYDAPRALANMRNMMQDNGRLGVVVHGDHDEVPYHGCMIREAIHFIPDYIPPGAPTLDRYSDTGTLRAVVEEAGFSGIIIRKETYQYSPGDYDDYWRNYIRYVARPLRQKFASLGRYERRRLREALREAVTPYMDSDGIINFPWQVLILAADR